MLCTRSADLIALLLLRLQFIAISGSHKAAFPLPNPGPPSHTPLPVLERVPTRRGDAVIFMASALTHGAVPWTKAGGRRVVVMGYVHDDGLARGEVPPPRL